MTYKLNLDIGKIISPVILILPINIKRKYKNGQEASSAEFNCRYSVASLNAVGDCIEVRLVEQESLQINWIGEEAIGFF